MESKQMGKMSVEHFHHFNCVKCMRWWGIGDPPEKPKELYCPWCGTLQEFEDKSPRATT